MRTLTRWYSLLITVLGVGLPMATHAVPRIFDPANTLKTTSTLGNVSPALIVGGIIQSILMILGIIALVLIIYAGFVWMFSRGNEEKVGTAVGILRDASIGLLIILGAYGISYYIFDVLEWATGT